MELLVWYHCCCLLNLELPLNKWPIYLEVYALLFTEQRKTCFYNFLAHFVIEGGGLQRFSSSL